MGGRFVARSGGSTRTGRSRTAIERYLPVGYFALAVALVLLVLPTVLRVPPDQAHSQAEFDPGLPPNEQQQSIVSVFNKGTTGTAGAGEATTGVGDGPGVGPGAGPGGGVGPGAPIPAPRGCPHGVGNPPRQDFSLYSPPCAPAWTGDNGGATWKGVTANEIRIAFSPSNLEPGTQPSNQGPVPTEPQGREKDADRTWRVLQAYLNANYQFYGRQIRLVFVKKGQGAAGSRDAAVTADTQYHVFGMFGVGPPMHAEGVRRGLVMFGSYQNPESYYANNQPYEWSWAVDADKISAFTAEFVCKQLAGKPADHTGPDALIQGKPRKFGLIVGQDDDTHTGGVAQFRGDLDKACGQPLADSVEYNASTDAGNTKADGVATAIAKMKSDGVTTVICACDPVLPTTFTGQATQQSYFPEWLMIGTGRTDENNAAVRYDKAQWSHAFGFTAQEMAAPAEETDAYRAYHSIDPNNDPNYVFCTYVYESLFGLMAGIQQAGPDLKPTSVQSGLFKLGYRFHEHPIWAIGGGFSADDPTYTDNVTEIWWDPTADEPNANTADGQKGAYRYVRGGKRYRLGELPREDPLVFQDGVTETTDNDSEFGD